MENEIRDTKRLAQELSELELKIKELNAKIDKSKRSSSPRKKPKG
jgi:hypothetical protein